MLEENQNSRSQSVVVQRNGQQRETGLSVRLLDARRPLFLIWFLIGLFTLVLGCVILFITSMIRSSTPVIHTPEALDESLAMGRHFYASLIRHDYALAFDDLSSQAAAKTGLHDLESEWSMLEDRAGQIAVEGTSGYIATGRNESSHVLVTLRSSGGRQFVVRLLLTKDATTWKIADAQPALIPTPK